MCIQRCFRNLILKKNVNKSPEINTVEKKTEGDTKPVKGKPPDEKKEVKAGTTENKAGPSADQPSAVGTLQGKAPADKTKPAKLPPLKEVQPAKKVDKESSARSLYNTFLTEHFENAQITHIVNFKQLDFAAAFAPMHEHTAMQRSTEEMRGDTLYKVLDDFPDLILPPMVDIDRTLPFLRELKVQPTPSYSPNAPERRGPTQKLKVLLTPLACVGMLDFCDAKKLLQTQEEEDGGSRSHAQLSTEEKVKKSAQRSMTAREPEFVTPVATAGSAEMKPSPNATKSRALPTGSQRRTTRRQRNPLRLLRKLLSTTASKENVTMDNQN